MNRRNRRFKIVECKSTRPPASSRGTFNHAGIESTRGYTSKGSVTRLEPVYNFAVFDLRGEITGRQECQYELDGS